MRKPAFLKSGNSSSQVGETSTVEPLAPDEYWRELTRWFEPRLSARKFGALVGLTEASVRQNLARGTAGFPQPMNRGWRNEWSEAQAFELIRSRKPRRGRRTVDGIPRLYHDGNGLGPAEFVAAEVITLLDQRDRPREWVIHRWQPADDRGVVAVAYVEPDYPESWWAMRLLAELGGVSAVAVITDHEDRTSVSTVMQGQIVVAEPGPDGVPVARTYGWFDLANLLRVNIPWWPYGLRDLDAMAAWRPGAAAQAVRPRTEWYDEQILSRLVPEGPSPIAAECRRLVQILNRRIESRIYTADDVDIPGDVMRPGITQAAFPRYAMHEVPAAPEHHELATLFSVRVPSVAARLAARDLLRRNPDIRQYVDYTICSEPDRGPLATEWVDRLEPLAGDPQTLGATFAEIMLSGSDDHQLTWWTSRQDPNCWVIKTADDVVYATVGTKVPATGHLREFELQVGRGRAAYFRDSAGVVWPMPPRGFAYHNCGYNGTGPIELAEAVTALRKDAAVDLVALKKPPLVSGTPLLKRIVETTSPLVVFAAELDELLPLHQQRPRQDSD